MDESIPPEPVVNQTPPPPPPPPPRPPVTPPPVFVPAGRPSPQKKGKGWMIAAIILFVFLAGSLLMNFGQLISSVSSISGGGSGHHSPGPRMEEVTVQDNDASEKILVIRIEGVITGARIDGTAFNMVDTVKEQLRRAEKDKRVQAVLLKVDSPGGEVLASDEIAIALREFQKKGKPVIVSMGNLAASGGYYVSAPCRYIVANDLTITGSIGVIMSGLNYRGLMDKVGLRPQVFKSGKYKDMLSGSRNPDTIPPEETAMVQNLINEVYGKFTNVVVTGRSAAHKLNQKDGKALAEDWSSYVDGRVLSGTEALKLGFVDKLGNFDDAVDKAKELTGLSNANLIEYRRVSDLSELFQMFGKTEAKPLKVDLGIDLPKLKAGQPYFLSADYLY